MQKNIVVFTVRKAYSNQSSLSLILTKSMLGASWSLQQYLFNIFL